MTTRDAAVDLRFRAFVWLLAISIPGHFVLWLRPLLAAGNHLYGLGDPWSAGFHLPEPWQLIFSQMLLWLAAARLAFARVTRPALIFFFAAALAQSLLSPANISNHWTLVMFALGICAAFPIPKSGQAPAPALSMLRAICALTYWFACLHKLNHGYIHPETSDVSGFARMILENVPGLDAQSLSRHSTPFIFASLLLEFSLPILLLTPRLRRLGCLLGLVFHGTIVLCMHGDYSQTILSFYVLFFDEAELASLLASLRRLSRSRAFASALLASLGMRVSYLHGPIAAAGNSLSPPHLALWTEWSIDWACLFFSAYFFFTLISWSPPAGSGQPSTVSIFRSPRWRAAGALILAAYSFNCMGPYLGLQFHHAQAMFSSINIEATNHLFLPKLELFHNGEYVRDLRVEWSRPPDAALLAAHPDLAQMLNHRGRILGNELRALLAHACADQQFRPLKVSYQISGGAAESFDPCSPLVRYTNFNAYPWFWFN